MLSAGTCCSADPVHGAVLRWLHSQGFLRAGPGPESCAQYCFNGKVCSKLSSSQQQVFPSTSGARPVPSLGSDSLCWLLGSERWAGRGEWGCLLCFPSPISPAAKFSASDTLKLNPLSCSLSCPVPRQARWRFLCACNTGKLYERLSHMPPPLSFFT